MGHYFDHMVHSFVRLDRLLATRYGLGSRTELSRAIMAGQARVEGKLTLAPSTRVSSLSPITFRGQKLDVEAANPPLLALLHKPVDVLSVMGKDGIGRRTLDEFVPEKWRRKEMINDSRDESLQNSHPQRKKLTESVRSAGASDHPLHPVGRLDRDSSGLLIFSSHGHLTDFLLSPKSAIPREYLARVEPAVPDSNILTAKLAAGVEVPGVGVVKVKVVDCADAGETVRLIAFEGQHRIVRRLLANVGHKVTALERVRFGEAELGDLRPGEFTCAPAHVLEWARGIVSAVKGRRKGPRSPARQRKARRTREESEKPRG